MPISTSLGRFAIRHRLVIAFVCLALCVAGAITALSLPSSVFPQTNFPRVVIMVDNGVMPVDEMMATVTRPIEESMKDLPGVVRVRSTTGRGSAEVSIFFTWKVDMVQSELHVESRLSQIRAVLPRTVTTSTRRLTFSAFPIFGVSLTSPHRSNVDLWEIARYQIKPRFLRIPGVARVDLVGGRAPEFQIIVDPLRLLVANLTLTQVTEALTRNNQITSTGMHEENHTLYLAVVDSRVHNLEEIENLIVSVNNGRAIRVRDFARVERGPEPAFNVVTAEGVAAVLLNVRSQPDGSTMDIAQGLKSVLQELNTSLPPDVRLVPFYDQSLFIKASVGSVWDAVLFGLFLSVAILYLFLRNWGTTLTAILVIPVTVLMTLLAMGLAGYSLNIITLGGIAAAIGLVIDDAIVVVEAIFAKIMAGVPRRVAVETAVGELFRPLVGSTLTPVVVFMPLALLDGITGVFFRALAMTMVVSLLTSLVLAVTLTPSLAAWLLHEPKQSATKNPSANPSTGFLLRYLTILYESVLRTALRHRWSTLLSCAVVLFLGVGIYRRLEVEFLPPMDEGGFVIDYVAPWGTSLTETHRQLLIAEKIIREHPDIESYSRRTGAALGFEVVEPNSGDFMIKLKPGRKMTTEQVVADLRGRFNSVLPDIEWEFQGILSDLIGDLTSEPRPIEVKLFSPDIEFLKKKAPEIEEQIGKVKGVVDTKSGLIYAGPSLSMHPKMAEMERFGLTAADIATVVNTAMLGETASSVLDGDRVIAIRVKVDPARIDRISTLAELPLRPPDGTRLKLSQLVQFEETPGQLEPHRDDHRQKAAVSARL